MLGLADRATGVLVKEPDLWDVPFFDLTRQYHALRTEILEAVDRVLSEAALSQGPYVERFEAGFAELCGTRYCAGVSSGTDSLHLALRALGVGPGDEVIVPANTFVATAWAPLYLGARPVFVDVDPLTWNIDPQAVTVALGPRTRAVIAVHLYGQPADMDALRAVTAGREVALLEDAAQAHGARYRGRPVGSLGVAAAFSFYPSKNLAAYGEAGAVTTSRPDLVARVQTMRNQGVRRPGRHEVLGFNMRMDGVQAAVLLVKLRHLAEWNARRASIAERYRAALRGTGLAARTEPGDVEPVHHLFVVQASDREALEQHLHRRGIETRRHYELPCHLQPALAAYGGGPGSLPIAERLAEHGVSLPLFPEMTDAQVEQVAAALAESGR